MELTVENVYEVLDSTEHTLEKLLYQGGDRTKKFSLKDYDTTIRLLLDSFFGEYKIRGINGEPSMIGGKYILDKLYEEKVFKNVTELSFIHFYPNLAVKLTDNTWDDISFRNDDIDPYGEENWGDDISKDKLIWSIKEFPILYEFLLKNRKEIKKYNNEKVDVLIKILLNFTYGAINNRYYQFIKCSNPGIIASKGRDILDYFAKNFPEHFIHADCDEIWFSAYDEIKEDVENKLLELGLEYRIEDHLYFVPFKFKRFIVSDHEIRVRGFGGKIIDNLRKYLENRRRTIDENRKRMEDRRQITIF